MTTFSTEVISLAQPFGAASFPGIEPEGLGSWFCVRTQPKHEHIAAAQLRQDAGLDVFLPRIRYRRPGRLGPAWVTEALFRDYFFARFDLKVSLRRVQFSRGVRDVVHFGDRWPSVPNLVIEQLKASMGGRDMCVVEDSLGCGNTILIASGAMAGLRAVVTRIIPAKERVAVLLEFLGQQISLEVDRHDVRLAGEDGSYRPRAPILQGLAEKSPSDSNSDDRTRHRPSATAAALQE